MKGKQLQVECKLTLAEDGLVETSFVFPQKIELSAGSETYVSVSYHRKKEIKDAMYRLAEEKLANGSAKYKVGDSITTHCTFELEWKLAATPSGKPPRPPSRPTSPPADQDTSADGTLSPLPSPYVSSTGIGHHDWHSRILDQTTDLQQLAIENRAKKAAALAGEVGLADDTVGLGDDSHQ